MELFLPIALGITIISFISIALTKPAPAIQPEIAEFTPENTPKADTGDASIDEQAYAQHEIAEPVPEEEELTAPVA